ncbi:MAG TPA: glycosyltransferase [Baekduia sp.]|uniref:glycosyltransferase n=1 Tax=Baekduia sp. TaxID=2600305 RepID=UPI002BD5DD9C|nr:glycosyltransferase [Baekduia sp.]HMJ36429.1 glycosyltransferase [Baekduia sp.]
MAFVDLAPGAHLDVERGDVVVCIPLYSGHDHFVRCLYSLLAHTPASVLILVADDCTPEPASRAFVEELERSGALTHEVAWMRGAHNVGFVENVNRAFAAAAPADVVIVNSDVIVAMGWLEGMHDAVRSDSTIATATALTNHGTIVSVPHRNNPQPRLPMDLTLEDAAERVRRRSVRLRPRLPVAIGHCLYVRRSALDLVGDFDLAFAPGYGEEVDFSQRCLAMGLQHVVADDVFVAHHGGGSFEALGQRSETQIEHERIIDTRYPYYARVITQTAGDPQTPLARSLSTASRALRGLRVTVDGRALGPALTGTQVHTLELVAALARTGEARVRVLLPHDVGEYVAPALYGLPGVELLHPHDADNAEPDDIVHRPWQVGDVSDLALLGRLGQHMVLTQQDFIAYRNPSYFPTADAWLGYRALAAEAMSLGAVVLFFSRHACMEALAEELVPEHRARVVLIGTDHQVSVQKPAPQPPARELADRPFLLCLGTDFRHKNRVFALRVFESLRERHGWPGRLVLAGPRVAYGSSSADEAAFLAARPQLAEAVVDLPAVSEVEKAWLLTRCSAVLYPTTYEGFGLVPFEAADHGRPCLFAHQASLVELFDPEQALLVPWDADTSADRVIGALSDPDRAQALVDGVYAAAGSLTWDRTAQGLLAAYRDALAMPARSAARAAGGGLAADARYWTLRHQIGPTGMSLVGPYNPEGPLLPPDAQRTIAALARRSATRGPLLKALRLLGRMGGRGGRNGSANGGGDVTLRELEHADDRPALPPATGGVG